LKDQPDPVAKPDEEYPEWLWTIIPTAKKSELATQPKQIPKKGHEFDFVQEKKRLRAM
jgi:large subunit ribosomal protein L54